MSLRQPLCAAYVSSAVPVHYPCLLCLYTTCVFCCPCALPVSPTVSIHYLWVSGCPCTLLLRLRPSLCSTFMSPSVSIRCLSVSAHPSTEALCLLCLCSACASPVSLRCLCAPARACSAVPVRLPPSLRPPLTLCRPTALGQQQRRERRGVGGGKRRLRLGAGRRQLLLPQGEPAASNISSCYDTNYVSDCF